MTKNTNLTTECEEKVGIAPLSEIHKHPLTLITNLSLDDLTRRLYQVQTARAAVGKIKGIIEEKKKEISELEAEIQLKEKFISESIQINGGEDHEMPIGRKPVLDEEMADSEKKPKLAGTIIYRGDMKNATVVALIDNN